MDELRIAQSLEPLVGKDLASDITADFVKLRHDASIGLLERTSAGKFVESFVRCLEYISGSPPRKKIRVDEYLDRRVENEMGIPDGLRLCGSRIARAIYTIRNQRSVAHKNEIDPNRIDLDFTYHGASWIVAEMIRTATGLDMEEAAAVIRIIRAPAGTLVEEIGDTRIVLHDGLPLRAEILLLLYSEYPDSLATSELVKSTGKSSSTVSARLSELRRGRFAVGDGKGRFRLTSKGHAEAAAHAETLQG